MACLRSITVAPCCCTWSKTQFFFAFKMFSPLKFYHYLSFCTWISKIQTQKYCTVKKNSDPLIIDISAQKYKFQNLECMCLKKKYKCSFISVVLRVYVKKFEIWSTFKPRIKTLCVMFPFSPTPHFYHSK